MRILAIDPGTVQSAFVVFDFEEFKILEKGISQNIDLNCDIEMYKRKYSCKYCVIEMIKSYGNVMGDSCLETCVWIGRFIESWGCDATAHRIIRKKVVGTLCNNARAKDKNVRQALLDAFSDYHKLDNKQIVGTKKDPGILYGVAKDIWAALAVAFVWGVLYKEAELFSD